MFMTFAGVNYLAVIVAAIMAFIFGAAYYGLLSKPWMKAARIQPKEGVGGAMPPAPLLINSIVCGLIMAWVLAAVLGSMGAAGIAAAVTAAFFLWLGFIATTIAVNQRYQGYGWNLTVIDAIHWLGATLIMAIVIGWWG
jgi:uncharacterized protein YacL